MWPECKGHESMDRAGYYTNAVDLPKKSNRQMGTNQTPPAGADNAASQELFGKQRPKTTQLEILQALHTANFNRWDKRRNYEWLP